MTVAKLTPRPEQEAAIQRMIAEPTHGILLADVPGKGKTLQGSEFVVRLGLERVLYVGIRETFTQWRERLEAQSDGAIKLRRLDSTKAGALAFADFLDGKPGHYFATTQMLTARDWEHHKLFEADGSPKWKRKKATGELILDKKTGEPTQASERFHLRIYSKMKPVDAILFDECHVIQSRTSIQRKTLLTIKTTWKVAMSGTFFGNKSTGMWSPTKWLWPDLIDGSYWRWVARWLVSEDVYLPQGKTTTRVVGERVEGAFVATLPCYLRQEDTELPPAPRIVEVDLTEEQRDMYESLERDLLVWLDDHYGDRQALVADLPIVLRQRLRTAALGEMVFDEFGDIGFSMQSHSSKLFALRGVLDGWGKESAVIFTDSKKFAKITVARMKAAGYGAAEWSGDISSKERDAIKARFIAGDPETRYIVGVIPALSTGIDGLQYATSKVCWLSQSENGIQNVQALARVFRPGVDYDKFEQVVIQARDTLDQGVFSGLLAQRLSMVNSLRLAA